MLAGVLVAGLSSLSMAAWIELGPEGGPLRAFAVAPSNENLIYAAPFGNPSLVHKSTNGGATWTRTGIGSIPTQVYDAVVDPGNPNCVYAAAANIYKSTNGGSNWISFVISNSQAQAIAVHPSNPNTLFAGGSTLRSGKYVMGFFKSTNAGTNWTVVPFDTGAGSVCGVALDPSNPNVVFASGYSYMGINCYPRIFKSTDGGSSFGNVTDTIFGDWTYAVAVHPANSAIVYTGAGAGGVWRSTNGGIGWTQVLDHVEVRSLTTTPIASDLVFAGSDSSIYRSTDAGVSWERFTSGLRSRYYHRLYASHNQANLVLASNNGGLFRSTNGGANWTISNSGMKAANISRLGASHSVGPGSLYAEFLDLGVCKSTNYGNTWTYLPEFLSCGDVCAFALHNRNPDFVFALEGVG